MYGSHIINQILNDKLEGAPTLHVVRCVSNPARYHSRYRLAREQAEFLARCPNIKLYTVEATYGERAPEIVTKEDDQNLRVVINSEIWIKENLINLGVKHLLPRDWKYLAWIDADVIWNSIDWGTEALQQLQHYPIIQPWMDGLDLGRHGNVLSHFKSFGWAHFKQFESQLRLTTDGDGGPGILRKEVLAKMPKNDYRRWGHTGYAWACTRNFWENVGGLMDFAILGSGDHNMATACVGAVDHSIHKEMSEGFKLACEEWQTKALRICHGEVGYTNDRIEHLFHGPKKRRFYRERWKILTHYKFDPKKDLMYDEQGVIRLVGKPELEQALRHYNRSRHEDDITEG